MHARTIPLLAFWALLWAVQATADDRLKETLRHRLEIINGPGELVAGAETLHAGDLLKSLYLSRGWRPLWSERGIDPARSLEPAFRAMELAHAHGLEPEHYHRERLVELLARLEDGLPGDVARQHRIDIELLASDALLTMAHHLAHGRVDPETIDPETIDPDWHDSRDSSDLLESLATAENGRRLDIAGLLERVAPNRPEYRALVERLALQRRLAGTGDWSQIQPGALVHPGDRDERVGLIRQRLVILGDLGGELEFNDPEEPDWYDPLMAQAIARFQHRHGLDADGVIGARTLSALNISPEQRVDQLRANLERWRWLPHSLGDEYIIVNIAGFSMEVVSQGETVMRQRVVVGSPYRRTPVFTGRMTYLVLNPSWEVPRKLAVLDQLPRIQADIAYLDDMGFSLLQGWGVDERRIDPDAIDWRDLSAKDFPYRLRQAPGPKNALGQIKFMFPNPHHVYLHDTPSRGLFSEDNRALSSGCIRIEDAHRLAQWLLIERDPVLSPQHFRDALDSGTETTIRLDRPIAVHLLYWTAWVDENGTVNYRPDVYQRDRPVIEALDSRVPRAIQQEP